MQDSSAICGTLCVDFGVSAPRIALLPGLGADRRLLEPTIQLLPGATAQDLLAPLTGETFAAYARRCAASLLDQGATFLGGFSFGGMIALEAARDEQLRSRMSGVVLIASCASRDAITPAFRRQANAARLLPPKLVAWGLKSVMPDRFRKNESLSEGQAQLLRAMAEGVVLNEFLWGAQQCANWDFRGVSGEFPNLPVLQLHGRRDTVIPGTGTGITWNDEAGHFLTWTHPEWCAEQIALFMEGVLHPQ